MSKSWNELEAHRQRVRAAILDATAALVTERGPAGVTMPLVAERAGVGRATVEKYFRDVDAILRAWHDRQVSSHLAYLAGAGDQPSDPMRRLDAMLRAYAVISQQTHEHRATERGASLHRDEHVAQARHQLHEMVRNLLAEGITAGYIRADVRPDELVSHCLHALSAAGDARSAVAVRQLVADTLAELRGP